MSSIDTREAVAGPSCGEADGDLPEGVVVPEADVLVVPRPRMAARLGDDALVAALVESEAMGRRVDALRVALAGEVAERSRRELGSAGLAARRGCRNAVELVPRATGCSGASVNRRIRLGRATHAGSSITGERLPPLFEQVAQALEIGRAHV